MSPTLEMTDLPEPGKNIITVAKMNSSSTNLRVSTGDVRGQSSYTGNLRDKELTVLMQFTHLTLHNTPRTLPIT